MTSRSDRLALVCAPTLALALALADAGSPVRAEVSRVELARIGVHTPPGARAPLAQGFIDQNGRPTTLAAAKGSGVGLLVFADYRCNTLCGPALAIVAAAVKAGPLRPGLDFRLLAIGLNPHATLQDAEAMRTTHLGGDPALLQASSLLTGAPAAIARTTHALGYDYDLDPATGQYVHPVAAFVLAPDGRVTRVLSEIALTGPQVAAAIRSARTSPPSPADGLIDRLSLLCHGLVPSNGRNDAAVLTGLRLGAGLTLLAIAASLGALMLRRRRAA